MKDQRMTFVLEEELKEKLMEEAKKKGMSASTLMRLLVIKYFEKGEL